MTNALAKQVPPLPPVLVAKAAELRMHAHALSAENDFCDTCKMVVVEAASILGNLVSNPATATRPSTPCADLDIHALGPQ